MSLLTDSAFVTSRTVTENYTPVVTQAVAYTPFWAYIVLFQLLVGLAIGFGIYVVFSSQKLRRKFLVRLSKACFDVAVGMIKDQKKQLSPLDAFMRAFPPPEPVVPVDTSPAEPVVVSKPEPEPEPVVGTRGDVVSDPEPEPEPAVDPALLGQLAEVMILIQRGRPAGGIRPPSLD